MDIVVVSGLVKLLGIRIHCGSKRFGSIRVEAALLAAVLATEGGGQSHDTEFARAR